MKKVMDVHISFGVLQSFPQVLRAWGESSKFDGGGLSQNMGGAWGSLKCCQKIPVKEFI